MSISSQLNPDLIIGTALSIVVGLYWKEAIQAGIDKYGPKGREELQIKLIYAIGLTITLVLLGNILDKIFSYYE